MSVAEQQREWFEQLADSAPTSSSSPEPDWLSRQRSDARQALRELPLPSRKSEAWRYSNIDGLIKNAFQPIADDAASIEATDVEAWLVPSYEAYRLVFANGRFLPALSQHDDLPEGATFANLRAALAEDPELLSRWFGHTADHTEHVFTALNTALANDGAFIHLQAGVEIDRPIEVVHLNLGHDKPILMQPRQLVVLEKGARATLVERFVGTGDTVYFHNNLTELVLEEAAQLAHYRLQDESRAAYHLSSLYLSQASDSHYQGTSLAFGGAWARTDYNSCFRHEGARCELNGLYTVGDRQLSDFHLNVRHNVPGCASQEKFKGILYGRGRAVFDGRILVEKQAQHSDAHLSNDNLMLTRDAEVDTKPQLEIYADDVKCSHGTTVGQLDPQQLFYMRSRGIGAAAARRMLCLGFAGEIIESIAIPALQEYAGERLAASIHAVEPARD